MKSVQSPPAGFFVYPLPYAEHPEWNIFGCGVWIRYQLCPANFPETICVVVPEMAEGNQGVVSHVGHEPASGWEQAFVETIEAVQCGGGGKEVVIGGSGNGFPGCRPPGWKKSYKAGPCTLLMFFGEKPRSQKTSYAVYSVCFSGAGKSEIIGLQFYPATAYLPLSEVKQPACYGFLQSGQLLAAGDGGVVAVLQCGVTVKNSVAGR